MRVAQALLVGATLAAGLGMGVGRAPSVDMVSARYSSALPNPTHLGHWEGPVPGRTLFISASTMVAGTGAGNAVFEVQTAGGTLCTLTVPCTASPAEFLDTECAGTIAAGAQVHLAFSHTCTSAPEGTLVFGFEWAR